MFFFSYNKNDDDDDFFFLIGSLITVMWLGLREMVSGFSPWVLLFLEMGPLPESANYLYQKDKINGLLAQDCAQPNAEST